MTGSNTEAQLLPNTCPSSDQCYVDRGKALTLQTVWYPNFRVLLTPWAVTAQRELPALGVHFAGAGDRQHTSQVGSHVYYSALSFPYSFARQPSVKDNQFALPNAAAVTDDHSADKTEIGLLAPEMTGQDSVSSSRLLQQKDHGLEHPRK